MVAGVLGVLVVFLAVVVAKLILVQIQVLHMVGLLVLVQLHKHVILKLVQWIV